MDELKDTIAKNLVQLRTQSHLTQLQLAKLINYSDKAVSKWERGEAIPDMRVLIKLSEIYGVTIDDIVKTKGVEKAVQPKKRISGLRAFIVAMAAVLVWFIATGVFMIFYFITPTADYAWLVFVVAPLPTAIVFTVFAALWGNRLAQALASSTLIWACALILHIFVITFTSFDKMYYVYVVAGVFELLVILWFTYRWYLKKKHSFDEKQ